MNSTHCRVALVAVAACGLALACTSSAARNEPDPRATRITTVRAAAQPGPTTPPDESTVRSKKGFVGDIDELTERNADFRRVLYTGEHSQLVLMAIPPRDHIGEEVHDVDQFFRVEAGTGEVLIGQERSPVGPGSAIVIPAGTKHDIINTGREPLRMYTIYSPPQHRDGTVHRTRADAEKDDEHFDGRTTE